MTSLKPFFRWRQTGSAPHKPQVLHAQVIIHFLQHFPKVLHHRRGRAAAFAIIRALHEQIHVDVRIAAHHVLQLSPCEKGQQAHWHLHVVP